MNPGDSFAQILQSLAGLMQTHAGFFQAAGWGMYGACTLIALMLFGVKIAGDRWEMDWKDLFYLLFRIGITGIFVAYWNSPVPGFGGDSGYQLIANLGTTYANQLESGLATQVLNGLASLYWNLETPWLSLLSGGINLFEFFTYGIVMFFTLAFGGVVIYVISLGLFATAIGILIGPLMIPFLIVPGMEYMFWNWLRAFMAYSLFYPLCGFAFLFVFGNLILNFVHSNPSGDLTSVGVYIVIFVGIMVASVGVALKIPSIAGSYASGSAGQSSLW